MIEQQNQTTKACTGASGAIEWRLAAAFQAAAEIDKKNRTVPKLLAILEVKVSDLRASFERHGGRNIPLLAASIRAYADLLEVAHNEQAQSSSQQGAAG